MRFLLLLLIPGCTMCCISLLAQDEPPVEEDGLPGQNTAVAASDPYAPLDVPLTLGQKYIWSLHQVFNPGRLLAASARAAFDHAGNDPSAWGQGAEGYALRTASRIGAAAVRENLAFGIRALDHEDPRYFRSGSSGVLKRARYAVSRTFVAKNDAGGTMPAYSTLVANFATPFIAQTWRPEPVRAGRELRTAAMGTGIDAATNIGREFWPDIRKKLRH